MLGFDISVTLDADALVGRYRAVFSSAVGALGDAVMDDCEVYVPYDTGNLCRSAARSPVTAGDDSVRCDVVWSAPYASSVYYGDTRGVRFRTEHHPHARARWFEGAQAVCGERWTEIVRGTVAG